MNTNKIHGNKKINTKIFIERAHKIHGNKYNYFQSNYSKFHTKLIITCPKHGNFKQSPYLHLRGSGCPICYGNKKSTTKEFIEKAQNIHDNLYDYSKSIYINNHTKLIIICSKHGDFLQTPTRHLSGDGCPICGNIITAKKNTKTTQNFIEKAQNVHGNLYDYSKSIYSGWNVLLIIVCSKHGEFEQTPSQHLRGSGCPDCGNYSKGELKIKRFLDEKLIQYERQKMFDDCIGVKRKLPFDFYLPDYGVIIEFDGIQHFKAVKRFGGELGLEKTKINDEIKNKFCENNSNKLIRIKYNENIINKLKSIL